MAFIHNDDIKNRIQPVRASVETGNYRVATIERFITDIEKENTLNLNPEYQRGLAWNEVQQTKFIENLLRGLVPHQTNLIRFNDPSLGNIHGKFIASDSDLPNETQCIDGLQRFMSMLRYMRGELSPFDLSKEEIEKSYYGVRAQNLSFTVGWYDFQYESDLLEYYRDLNWGGIPHSLDELNRINSLIDQSKKKRGVCNA